MFLFSIVQLHVRIIIIPFKQVTRNVISNNVYLGTYVLYVDIQLYFCNLIFLISFIVK